MKKILALVLCAVICFTFTACFASSRPEETTAPTTEASKELPVSGVEGAYKYDEYSDHIVLTEFVGTNPELFIPDTIKGKPVTEFGTIFKGNMSIVSVRIGKNCTEIADNAFTDCYSLRRVQIDAGVKSIGKLAFFGCQALELIYIPACVEHIENDAFKYCTDMRIFGSEGSEAERFASNYSSIYFMDIDDMNAQETTTAVEGTTEETTTEAVTQEASSAN